MNWYKIVARLSHANFSFLKKLTNFLDAMFSGVWLGLMGKKSLEYSDELYYNNTTSYSDEKYNESGFFNWEKPVIEKYFSGCKTILLIAAGGGREVIALSKMGIEVDAYECNNKLTEFGNSLLAKRFIKTKIEPISRNSVPDNVKQYDGIILGWGAYSLMKGNHTRIEFLSYLKPFLKSEACLMVSFIYSVTRSRKDKFIKRISDLFAFFKRDNKPEIGDRLVPNFIHYFSEEEIKSEFSQAGLKIIDYSSTDYGYLIAQK